MIRTRFAIPLLMAALVVLAFMGLALGATGGFGDHLTRVITGSGSGADVMVITHLRLPRVIGAIAVGMLLGAAGALLQAATRNVLAEPGTLGIAPAAGTGVAIATLAGSAGLVGGATSAVLGAIAGSVLIGALIARTSAEPSTIVLIGLALSVSFQAATALLMVMSGTGAQRVLLWVTGSLSRADPSLAWLGVVAVAVLLPAATSLSGSCDLLLLDEDSFRALGGSAHRSRATAGLVAALATAAAVAIGGVLGLIALMCPPAARQLTGTSRHFVVIPVAALLGAIIVLAADLAGRTALAPLEIPVGIVSGLAGAPILFAMLKRRTP